MSTFTLTTSTLLVEGTLLFTLVLFLGFFVHGLFLSYHWFQYGTRARTAWTALALYTTGGALLFLALMAARAPLLL